MFAHAGLSGSLASRFGRPLEGINRSCLYPCAGRIDEVPLHIEDELALAAHPCLSKLRLERRFRLYFEKPATLSNRGIGGIESEQRARRAARRNQEITAAHTQTLGILCRRCVRQAVAGSIRRRKRDRLELPVRGCIQFYGQP